MIFHLSYYKIGRENKFSADSFLLGISLLRIKRENVVFYLNQSNSRFPV